MNALRTLRWRLAAWTFAATAALALLLTLYYQRQTHGLLNREFEERGTTLARHLAAASVLGVIAHSEELLAGPLEGAMSQGDVEAVAFFDTAGGLVSGRSRPGVPTPQWREDSVRCEPCDLGGGRLRWMAPVVRSGGGRGFYDGPEPALDPGGSTAGWLLLDMTTAARTAAERQVTASGLAIAGVTLLLALAVTLLMAQRLTSPLRALAGATREIGRGRWNVSIPRGGSAEIAQLAEDFRVMTAALAELDRENARYREHLEEMVASRTRQLEEAYENMKAMAEAKDQFVATVSHDFRSPLAIVLSAVQTVAADPGMRDEVRREFLGRAERQCKRLGALVNDLLDLARIENRDTVLERVPLSGLVEEGIEAAQGAFEDKGVALAYEPPGEPIAADVDRGYVGRALANLLDNALKFTPPAGRVVVSLARKAGEACLSVSDTGPGIPDEERDRVFERFFQGRRGQALGSGSGLGLAIVAGVARRHGGGVAVTSAPGAGSTFQLRLPLSRG